MKKKLSAIILCFGIAILLFSATSHAYDFGGSNYNNNDYTKLKTFLNVTSDDGTHTNGQRLNAGYDPADPLTWGASVVWTDGIDKRVIQLGWAASGLAGELDLSGFTSLSYVNLRNNSITSVDVSGDHTIGHLDVRANDITELDSSGLLSLVTIYCGGCDLLTSVDVSGCAALNIIDAQDSMIDTLNVAGCTELTCLNADENKLTGLNIGSCTALVELYVRSNDLLSLDVSANTLLSNLNCENNEHLASLTILGAANLMNVNCEDCAIVDLDASGLTTLDSILCNANQMASLSVVGSTSLKTLECSNNNLTEIDGLSDAAGLELLICSNNTIEELDLSGMADLQMLACDHNELTTLDASGLASLFIFACGDNKLVSLDVTNDNALVYLLCQNNLLTTLDLSSFSNIALLNSTGNRLSSVAAVFSGTPVSLAASGAGYIGLYYDTSGDEYYADAAPGAAFTNWTDASHSAVSTDAKYDLVSATAYDLTANFGGAAKPHIAPHLTLTSSVADGKIAIGGRITLSPSVNGGTWAFDSTFFSREGSTFLALKEGISIITYTVGDESAQYIVTIAQELTLYPSAADGQIYTGGRITLTPNMAGGKWDFDAEYLSRDGYKFTGLKSGSTRVTYTLGQASRYFDVTIDETSLPQTGQNFSAVWILAAVSAGVLAAVAWIFLKRKNRA